LLSKRGWFDGLLGRRRSLVGWGSVFERLVRSFGWAYFTGSSFFDWDIGASCLEFLEILFVHSGFNALNNTIGN